MKENHISWVSTGQLAITSGEMNIRIWNLKNDDNFVLSYDRGDGTNKSTSEFITCLDYCASKGILSAGTNSGYIAMWKNADHADTMNENSWKCLPRVHIGNAVRNMLWGGGGGGGGGGGVGAPHVLALNTIRQVFFLFEQTRASHFHGGVSAVQTSPNELAVNFYNAERPLKIDSPVPVENVFLTEGGVFIYGAGMHENIFLDLLPKGSQRLGRSLNCD